MMLSAIAVNVAKEYHLSKKERSDLEELERIRDSINRLELILFYECLSPEIRERVDCEISIYWERFYEKEEHVSERTMHAFEKVEWLKDLGSIEECGLDPGLLEEPGSFI